MMLSTKKFLPVLFVATFLPSWCFGRILQPSPVEQVEDFAPVSNFTTASFLGRWYQVYGSRSVLYTFEFGGRCTTADYNATEREDVIAVTNSGRPFSLLPPFAVNGFAVQSPDADNTPGLFNVQLGISSFFGSGGDVDELSFNDGNYWIIELGPIVDEEYDWAIITNGINRGQLYILSRDVHEFEENYKTDVLAKAQSYGFTNFWNSPQKNDHSNCVYP